MKSDHAKLVEKLNEMKANGTLVEFFAKLKQAIMKVRDDELDKVLKGIQKTLFRLRKDLVKAFKKNPEAFGSSYRKSVGR